jgi:hypothetical protein
MNTSGWDIEMWCRDTFTGRDIAKAWRKGNVKRVVEMIRNGVDTKCNDRYRKPPFHPLHFAVCEGADCARTLIEHSEMDVRNALWYQDERGDTPLHYIFELRDEKASEIIEFLWNDFGITFDWYHGDSAITNKRCLTPLDHCRQMVHSPWLTRAIEARLIAKRKQEENGERPRVKWFDSPFDEKSETSLSYPEYKRKIAHRFDNEQTIKVGWAVRMGLDCLRSVLPNTEIGVKETLKARDVLGNTMLHDVIYRNDKESAKMVDFLWDEMNVTSEWWEGRTAIVNEQGYTPLHVFQRISTWTYTPPGIVEYVKEKRDRYRNACR